MNSQRPTTPPTTGACRCIGRCTCCDAPKRRNRFAHINIENVLGLNLFPGPFLNMERPQTPPPSEQNSCPGAPKKRRL
jgi:hypothetical protein